MPRQVTVVLSAAQAREVEAALVRMIEVAPRSKRRMSRIWVGALNRIQAARRSL